MSQGHSRQWSAFNILFFLSQSEHDLSYFPGGLMKAQTLKKNGDFKRLYSKGKSFVSPALVTYVKKNNKNNLRIGITTSKKIGSAVQRNRCRRIIRAAFNKIDEPCSHGADIVFVARTKTGFLKSTDIERCMREHLKQSGVIL